MTSKDWYALALVVVVFVTLGAIEYGGGYGVLAFPPGLFLANWLMGKVTDNNRPQ